MIFCTQHCLRNFLWFWGTLIFLIGLPEPKYTLLLKSGKLYNHKNRKPGLHMAWDSEGGEFWDGGLERLVAACSLCARRHNLDRFIWHLRVLCSTVNWIREWMFLLHTCVADVTTSRPFSLISSKLDIMAIAIPLQFKMARDYTCLMPYVLTT
jgi:hypothetical protein